MDNTGIEDATFKKKEFVRCCGALLNVAKPHLKSCELMDGYSVLSKKLDRQAKQFIAHHTADEFVYVHSDNGYGHAINVTGYSLSDIAKSIFIQMSCR